MLSNGPGELNTWVRPLVHALAGRFRISVALSHCPNASGTEAAVAASFPGVSRVLPPSRFLPFLLGLTWRRRQCGWRRRGVVLFLGGDQFFAACIARRLGYPCVAYAEWQCMWPQWIRYYGVRRAHVRDAAVRRMRGRRRGASPPSVIRVVGDLTADSVRRGGGGGEAGMARGRALRDAVCARERSRYLVALMPGSKRAKLAPMLPFLLACAERLAQRMARARAGVAFVIPLAAGLTAERLAAHADRRQSDGVIALVGGASATLVQPNRAERADAAGAGADSLLVVEGDTGTRVHLHTQSPAYGLLAAADLCLTTVGANTAELASLGTPSLVLLPTQQLDAMRAWDGALGLLCNLPLVGGLIARLVNAIVLWMYRTRRFGYVALPNKWARREVMPERVGRLVPADVADEAAALLLNGERRATMRAELRRARGGGDGGEEEEDDDGDDGGEGAVGKLANLVLEALADADADAPR